MLNNFLDWLLLSSANADQWSLTLKAFLYGLIPIATTLLGLANIQVGDLTPAVDAVIAVVQAAGLLVAAVVFAYGLLRKIVLTLKGQHASL